ncbi:MAG: hypothetical protein NTY09_05195 [bacterium]|nr:hypothetical protein [bacterium]
MRKSIHILMLVLLVVLTGHVTLAQDDTSSLIREEFPPVQIAAEGGDCLVDSQH